MPGIVGPCGKDFTTVGALDAHLSHLRHLAKPKTAERILVKRFGFRASEARTAGRRIATYVDQALEFHKAGRSASPRVKPVLQYYAYLNLSVAVVLAYQPPNYDEHRHHGVHDATHEIKKLELASPVVRLARKEGAIGLFHSVLADSPLPATRHLRLKELMVPIPMLEAELGVYYNVHAGTLHVTEQIVDHGEEPFASEVRFSWSPPPGVPVEPSRFPRKKIEMAMPILARRYDYRVLQGGRFAYRSKQTWARNKAGRRDAWAWHRECCFKVINFGSQIDVPGGASRYRWRYLPRMPMLPTMTASLLLAFALASLFRYRPLLAKQLDDSELNVLIDVFINEADGFMIPTFRNLLFAEELTFESVASL